MTVPSYSTDLSTFNLCENSGTFGEFTGMTDGGSPDSTDIDDPIQGTYLTSAQCSLKVGELQSIYADYGSGVTIPTDGAILIWNKFDAGGLLQLMTNGGVRIVVGSSASAWSAWKAGGYDRTPNPYGGWYNYAINPTARTADYTNGTLTTYNLAGMAISLTAPGPTKGQPFKIDAIRYGRCSIIFEYGSSADGYANFAAAATKNDANDGTNGYNKWGLFSAYGGGYLWKGRMQIGTTSNPCEFVDSNAFILIDAVENCTSNFNLIEINNISTVVHWTNVIFKALGTVSPGTFVMNADADLTFDSCQFTDMGTFVFDSNATINDNIFRRCGQITQAAALFDGCSFVESTGAVSLLVDNPDAVQNCSFVSDGSNHAIRLTADCAGGSYTLTNFLVSGYATSDGTTGNEVIYNDSGGAVTLNIDGGSGVANISVRNGTGASTTLVANYSFTITGLEQNTEVTIVTAGTSTVLFNVENATTSDGNGKYQVSYSHSGGASVDILIHHISYKPDISNVYGLSLPSSNSSIKVNMFLDGNYENPT
jgi:hypothetical protein